MRPALATRTPEQVQADYIEKIGEPLGAQFYRLINECHLLHVKWDYYVALYGTSQERLVLLNKAAPSFFRVIEDVLWDDVLLHITRLTENTVVGSSRVTLTIQRLPALVDEGIRGQVAALLAAALEAAAPLRDWRNRRIAHRDLRLGLGEAGPLASTSRAVVTRAVEAVTAVLKAVEAHYCDVDPIYLKPITFGTAEQLLYAIRDGVEAREQERARAQA